MPFKKYKIEHEKSMEKNDWDTDLDDNAKCMFMGGKCPFRTCKTHDDIMKQLQILRINPRWNNFFNKLSKGRISTANCPIFNNQINESKITCPFHNQITTS